MSGKTTGVALLEKYDGSEQSIRRVQAIIQTLAGQVSVVDACKDMGIGEAIFRRFRDVCLKAAISSLEPKKRGRKATPEPPGQKQIEALQQEVQRLKVELMGAMAREDLRRAGLVVTEQEPEKKTSRKRKQRRLRKA